MQPITDWVELNAISRMNVKVMTNVGHLTVEFNFRVLQLFKMQNYQLQTVLCESHFNVWMCTLNL